MGFGVLFIGYFLLLNVVNYTFTDMIAATVMAFGLAKLSFVNKSFKYATVFALIFSAVGALEFVSQALVMLEILTEPFAFTYPIRTLSLFMTQCLIMRGIYEVAKEVELDRIAIKAKRSVPFICFTSLVSLYLDIPLFYSPLPQGVAPIIFTVNLLLTFALIIYNLIIIYQCYANICMPSEEKAHKKESLFDKFEKQQTEKNIEYLNYRKQKRESKKK